MKNFIIITIAALLLVGCARKPMVIKYYPPCTEEQLKRNKGAVKEIDYRKPQGVVTILGFSVF